MRSGMVAILVLLVGACLLIGSSAPEPASAQLQPSADGVSLEGKARNALQSLISLAPASMWNELAPWKQNSVRLHKARVNRALAGKQLEWATVQKALAKADPADKLKIAAPEDFVALQDADYFGLFAGLYAASATPEIAAMLGKEWFMTQRTIGLGTAEGADDQEWLMQTVGIAKFETVEGAIVRVMCVAEGKDWYVISMSWTFGDVKGDTGQAMSEDGLFSKYVAVATTAAQRNEGEMLLGSMKNRVRVAYTKMGELPGTLTGGMHDGGCGVQEAELEGKYYSMRDTVKGSLKRAILVATSNRVRGACALLAFNVFGGDSSTDFIEHFDSTAKMDKRIEEIIAGRNLPKDSKD